MADLSSTTKPTHASADSTAQTGIVDWQEELYQMIKSLKDQHFVELNDLYNKLSIKIQHIDNHMPSQKSSEQYEKIKSFKVPLERMFYFLQVNKSNIQPGFTKQIPIYERQILSVLSRWKAVQASGLQTFQQSSGQAPSSNISQQHQTSQGLQQHDSHTDQKPQASLSSDCMNKGVVTTNEEAKEVLCHFYKKKDCMKRKVWFEKSCIWSRLEKEHRNKTKALYLKGSRLEKM